MYLATPLPAASCCGTPPRPWWRITRLYCVLYCTVLYCTVLYWTVQVVRCPVLYHNTSDTSETIYIEEEEGRYSATDPEAAPRAKSLRVEISWMVFLVLLFTSI